MSNVVINKATIKDLSSIVNVWKKTELTRPWNNPEEDAERALKCDTSTILVAKIDDNIIGTVVAGYDGHRGWVYYLAVDDDLQGKGIGALLYAQAEGWLKEQGAPKIQILIRADNESVVSFYKHLGFESSTTMLMGKKL